VDQLPDDYTTLRRFREAHPDVHTSMESLRWELRFRHDNGLVASGAIIERRSDPNASRPTLLISPSRYFRHLREQSKVA
jgi:hypothetical protein